MMKVQSSATSIPLLAAAFDANLQQKGRAASTRRKYRVELGRFEKWADGRSAIDLGSMEIQLFLAESARVFEEQHGRSQSPATQKGRITALKSFYGFLERFNYLVAPDGTVVKNPMLAID